MNSRRLTSIPVVFIIAQARRHFTEAQAELRIGSPGYAQSHLTFATAYLAIITDYELNGGIISNAESNSASVLSDAIFSVTVGINKQGEE